MQRGTLLLIGAGGAWAALLLGALSIAASPLDSGHAVCGVWGCGPPTHVLLSCHLAWIIVLAPLAVIADLWFSLARRRWVAFLLVAGATAAAVGCLTHEAVYWLPHADSIQAGYLWHRWLFVLATMVDVPVGESLLLGLFLLRPQHGLLTWLDLP